MPDFKNGRNGWYPIDGDEEPDMGSWCWLWVECNEPREGGFALGVVLFGLGSDGNPGFTDEVKARFTHWKAITFPRLPDDEEPVTLQLC